MGFKNLNPFQFRADLFPFLVPVVQYTEKGMSRSRNHFEFYIIIAD